MYDVFIGFDPDYNSEIYSPRKFQKVYVCLKMMKERLVNGCRPFIVIDCCHLKGSYGGLLLSVVGLCVYDVIYKHLGCFLLP
jgi:hypothetical protein